MTDPVVLLSEAINAGWHVCLSYESGNCKPVDHWPGCGHTEADFTGPTVANYLPYVEADGKP